MSLAVTAVVGGRQARTPRCLGRLVGRKDAAWALAGGTMESLVRRVAGLAAHGREGGREGGLGPAGLGGGGVRACGSVFSHAPPESRRAQPPAIRPGAWRYVWCLPVREPVSVPTSVPLLPPVTPGRFKV